MSRIRLITLDLDNTLWDVDAIIRRAEQDMVDWMHQHAAPSIRCYTPEQVTEARAAVAAEFPDKIHDLTFVRTRVLEAIMRLAGYTPAESAMLAESAFEVFFRGRNRVEFFPGAVDMLRDLSDRFPVYALTNGNADIEQAGLSGFLRGAYSSARVGSSKPSAEMFRAPLKDLGLNPDQAVHIGDHLIDDIDGARRVGMHTIWVNLKGAPLPDGEVAPSHAVTRLDQVAAAVQALHKV